MEKRRHKRINRSFSFYYRVYQKTNVLREISKIKDISSGGALVVSPRALIPGNILELGFRMPLYRKKVVVLGKVLDCKKSKYNRNYESRISFVHTDKDYKEMFEYLIEELDGHQSRD